MGIPDEPFWAPESVVTAVRAGAWRGGVEREAWAKRTTSHVEWQSLVRGPGSAWAESLPVFQAGESIATRVAIQKAFDAILPNVAGLVSGSADLTGNTGTKLSGQSAASAATPDGRQVYYGIREHAMGSIMVGMALHGGLLPVGGTFFVFFDYMKPPVRLAALSRAKCIFVFSHDSVGVGEDGPTHQPIEHLAALRAIPDLQVIRPCDANETSQALRAAIEHDGPTALVLSRQNLPVVSDGGAVVLGAGVLREGSDVCVVATGSEVAVALAAAERLAESGVSARVVSMPSWDRFESTRRVDRARADAILPPSMPTVSIEAGATMGWHKYADECIGIDRFGASAPGATALVNLGMDPANVVRVAESLLGRGSSN